MKLKVILLIVVEFDPIKKITRASSNISELYVKKKKNYQITSTLIVFVPKDCHVSWSLNSGLKVRRIYAQFEYARVVTVT